MIRVGLVGFGMAGKVFHAPMITAVDGLELAAVVERHTRNAELMYPDITTYTSLEAMLADTTLELIVVATPNTLHVPQAHEALAAGRHVVVDKPVGITPAEIADLIAHAKEVGRYVMPYHNRRWDNGFRTLKKLLHEERLGEIVSFEATFDRWRPLPRGSAWRETAGPGSGILLDLGTHLVDEALQLFGLPLSVSAEVICERPWAVANDSFTVRLRYSHMTATLTANCLAAMPRPHYNVRGTRGGYLKWGLDPQEARLKEIFRIEEPGWGVEPSSGWGTLAIDVDGNMVSQPIEPIPGDYRLYYSGARDAIIGKAAPPVEAIDALRAAKVLDWAEQSSTEHREIVCDWESTN
ncbi:Gfo/Idh/MocA family oxidoreductase [Acidicapsa ligni]|uniref:Gfo/Idh/MocA family oxidoreductase n=1 Tax=Acidicapsa ligni TaxID=542300 RepID=UPI0021DF9EAB|nr:Gfo/Idh/MocA family oxidoreductase [Acidicapsa ligni]